MSRSNYSVQLQILSHVIGSIIIMGESKQISIYSCCLFVYLIASSKASDGMWPPDSEIWEPERKDCLPFLWIWALMNLMHFLIHNFTISLLFSSPSHNPRMTTVLSPSLHQPTSPRQPSHWLLKLLPLFFILLNVIFIHSVSLFPLQEVLIAV